MQRIYRCKWRSTYNTHPWMIEGRTNDAFAYYEHKRDAWEFCKAMARKARGVAVLFNKDGGITKELSYGHRRRAESATRADAA